MHRNLNPRLVANRAGTSAWKAENPACGPMAMRFYDGLPFYRVIDGFVAEGGDGSDLGELSEVPLIEGEFEIEWSD